MRVMKNLLKEFKLELREVNDRKYVKVTNIKTNKIGFIYNNNNKVIFCGHKEYLETTGAKLIAELA